jgi:hypothetical protein
VWRAEIDLGLGCAGTLEAAIIMAARDAEAKEFPKGG